jgi:CBS domain-containing protein
MKTAGSVNAILQQKGSAAWSISPDATVFDAIKLMADKNIGALVVFDTNQRLVGIITERDYTRKVMLKGRSSKDTPVNQVMTAAPVTVDPGMSVTECMEIMTREHVRHLPVLEAGKLMGIISIGDLVKWIIAAQATTIEHLENYIAGTYPT